MAYEKRPNTGSLFKNDRRETDSHPNLTGTAIVTEPGEYYVSAWTKTRPNGDKWLSLSFKPKGDRVPTPQKSVQDDLDDEIPFN